MAFVDHDRRLALGPNGADGTESISIINPEVIRARRAREVAHTAIDEMFAWLDYQPHNRSNYKETNAYKVPHDWLVRNKTPLTNLVMEGVATTDDTHARIDLKHISDIETTNDRAQRGALIRHIAYGDQSLEEATDEARTVTSPIDPTNPEAAATDKLLTAEKVRDTCSLAIAKTAVRLAYLRDLAQRNPDEFSQERLEGFERLYSQNILSTIRKSARKEELIRNRSAATPAATPS